MALCPYLTEFYCRSEISANTRARPSHSGRGHSHWGGLSGGGNSSEKGLWLQGGRHNISWNEDKVEMKTNIILY
jgi:hypothetical protein